MTAILIFMCFIFGANGLISKNRNSDDSLPTPALIQKYGYPAETHKVQTDDKYILTMHRVPYGRNCSAEESKGVVLLQHGILCSSADWVFTGPEKGLADSCYDVWLGNSRGNHYSREHKILNPNINSKFWDFSWHEMGVYDVPAMVDYILAKTGKPNLMYAAHSQGTTISFLGNIFNPGLSRKIKAIFAMAPIAYLHKTKSLLLRAVSATEPVVTAGALVTGNLEFYPSDGLLSAAGRSLCTETHPVMPEICSNVIFLACGFDSQQLNKSILPTLLAHTPSGISTKQLFHFAQLVNGPYFRAFDNGPVLNFLDYGTTTPPNYNLRKVKIPTYLYTGLNDWLSDPDDVALLKMELGNFTSEYVVKYKMFNHLDFLFATDAKKLLYDKLIQDMDNVVRASQL